MKFWIYLFQFFENILNVVCCVGFHFKVKKEDFLFNIYLQYHDSIKLCG